MCFVEHFRYIVRYRRVSISPINGGACDFFWFFKLHIEMLSIFFIGRMRYLMHVLDALYKGYVFSMFGMWLIKKKKKRAVILSMSFQCLECDWYVKHATFVFRGCDISKNTLSENQQSARFFSMCATLFCSFADRTVVENVMIISDFIFRTFK